MGMYTEIYLKTKLSLDLPENIIFAFQNDIEAIERNILPTHNFFQCENWQSLFSTIPLEDEIFVDYKNEFVSSSPLSIEKKQTIGC